MTGDHGQDVIVYAGAAWDGPWLTEHHLARALAREHRVLFVEPPRSIASPLRGRGSLRERLALLRRLLREPLRTEAGVDVLRTLSLPPVNHPRARRLSAPWLRRQAGAAIRRLGLRPGLALASRAISEGLPAGERPIVVALVKDWLQAGAHLTGLDAGDLRRRELAAWRSADLVCAISTRLQERLAEDGIPSELLRHGFDASRAGTYLDAEHAPPPDALADLPRPILGCTGRLDTRWAFEDLGRLADRFPGGTLVLVGPVNRRLDPALVAGLRSRPNVRFFDAVPGGELPRWVAHFDCSLIPYTDDEWQFYASPIKVWDYFYAGVPIAATGSPALGEFPPGLVHFARDPHELPELVERALAEDRPEATRLRREYALANTWDDRARQLEQAVAARRAQPATDAATADAVRANAPR